MRASAAGRRCRRGVPFPTSPATRRSQRGSRRSGVPESWFLPLGLVKIAGALGLLAGIVYRPLGIAAAIGVVLYFLGAVITHARGGDAKGIGIPAVIMLVAVAPLVLGFATV
ncbi:DoxX family protein [Streptomyces sp. NPDC058676]|uniref:DoxX family protein n=1 Tax=unclassified Streptomyces TaxID=2593676 RepID=UPI00365C7396